MNEFMQSGTGFALSVSNGLHGMIFHSGIEKQIPSIKESSLYQSISILFKYALALVLVVPMIGLLLCIVALRVSIACIPMMFAMMGNQSDSLNGMMADENRKTDELNAWGELYQRDDRNNENWFK